MLTRRIPLRGLVAMLLALMVQLGVGASMPRIDVGTETAALCHTEDDADKAPGKGPYHPADCLICPLCVALHSAPALPVSSVSLPAPRAVMVVVKTELPPPSTAPPSPFWPPSQPRAPPTLS